MYENQDYTSYSKGLSGPSSIAIAVASTTAKTYNKDGTGDGYPPKAIRANGTGNLVFTDWQDNVVTLAVTVGDWLPIMPKTIHATNAIAIHVMY